jgi:hypothetical protein
MLSVPSIRPHTMYVATQIHVPSYVDVWKVPLTISTSVSKDKCMAYLMQQHVEPRQCTLIQHAVTWGLWAHLMIY